MRLDETTLQLAQFSELITALMTVPVFRNRQSRDNLIGLLPANIQNFPRSAIDREDVMSLWRRCSQHGAIDVLLEATRSMEPGSPELNELIKKIESLKPFARLNAPFIERLERISAALPSAAGHEESRERWLVVVRGIVPGADLGTAGQSLRDLLLVLNKLPADPQGYQFPLFTFIEGMAGDLRDKLGELALDSIRADLDSIALEHGVYAESITRLRNAVQAMRQHMNPDQAQPNADQNTALEPALLVVVEPQDPRKNTDSYRFLVYEWHPQPLEPSSGAGGTAGKTRLANEVGSFRAWKDVYQEIAETLNDLLSQWSYTKYRPLVEFLVPRWLLCEPFDQMELGVRDEDDEFGVSSAVKLGVKAYVVVRSWERAREKFRTARKDWHNLWLHRWEKFRSLPAPCWLKHDQNLYEVLEIHRNSGCLAVGFAPVSLDVSLKIYEGILKGGAPVALWLRDDLHDGNVEDLEQALNLILNKPNPYALRDSVRDERALAASRKSEGVEKLPPHIGEALTLFWDDPNRLPSEVEAPKDSPLHEP